MRFNWKAIGGAALTLAGVLAQNAGAFGKAAPVLSVLGLLVQAFTHPVAQPQQ